MCLWLSHTDWRRIYLTRMFGWPRVLRTVGIRTPRKVCQSKFGNRGGICVSIANRRIFTLRLTNGSKKLASTSPNDPSLLTFEQNFSAWWRIYQNSGRNTELGLCKRDYALLDEIYPGRIRSMKQWMEKFGYDGDVTHTFEAELPWGL
ncbi:hypothetical protein MKX08_008000 [Trichoderma sp. CBMAI-0020]|nr:hypothetical protein MKX08_008000 [Trichoderma sp. CBMAI-0020]